MLSMIFPGRPLPARRGRELAPEGGEELGAHVAQALGALARQWQRSLLQRRARREFQRRRQDRVAEFIEDAELERPSGGEQRAGGEALERGFGAREAREAHRAARAGDQSELHLRKADAAVARGEPPVTRERQLQTPAEGDPLDRRHDGLARGLDQRLHVAGERGLQGRPGSHFVDIRARREGAVRPGEDDGAHLVCLLRAREGGDEAGANRQAQGIHRGVLQGQNRNPALHLIAHARHHFPFSELTDPASAHCTMPEVTARVSGLHWRAAMEDIEAVVIGAGVVGLAVARELALSGRDTLILEAADRIGSGISARSSEVIHAGIYYPQGSLKARLCVAGRERLYAFCRKHAVAHRRCGKLIVATEAAQRPGLEAIAQTARHNDVDLLLLEGSEARRLEPELACEAALHSPLTGIVDSQGLMLALLAEAEAHGATLSTRSEVTRVVLGSEGIVLGVNGCEPGLRTHARSSIARVLRPRAWRAGWRDCRRNACRRPISRAATTSRCREGPRSATSSIRCRVRKAWAST